MDPGCIYILPSSEQVLKGSVQAGMFGSFKLFVVRSHLRKKAQTIHKLSLYKTINKLERICELESSSKSVKIVANIYVSLQFCGKAVLK